MLCRLSELLRNESGQDLMEYSLLLAFFAITTMWLVYGGSSTVQRIWTQASTLLHAGSAGAGAS
jgi:Flp pilus assembly pilin Flp